MEPDRRDIYQQDGVAWLPKTSTHGAYLAERIPVEKAPDRIAALRAEYTGKKKDKPEDDDVRTLEVAYDAGEERWQRLDTAVPKYVEEDFADWPLAGPRSCGYVMRQLRRSNLNWMTQHESWVARSGVRASDRSVHEHRALSRALEYLASYDQLQVPNLAGAEVIVRRRQLIEQAHSGHPEAPSYEGSEHFMGFRDAADGSVIDPAAVKYTTDRLTGEAKIAEARRKAAEEKRSAPSPKAPSPTAANASGRGSRGRGAE